MSTSKSRFDIPEEWEGKEDRIHFPYHTFDLGGHKTYAANPTVVRPPFQWSNHVDTTKAGENGGLYKPMFEELPNDGFPFGVNETKKWAEVEDVTERWLRDVIRLDKLAAKKNPDQPVWRPDPSAPLVKRPARCPTTGEEWRRLMEGATLLKGDIDPPPKSPDTNPTLIRDGIYISGGWIEEAFAPYFYALTAEERAVWREKRKENPGKWVREILNDIGALWDVFHRHTLHTHDMARSRAKHQCPGGDTKTCLRQSFATGWWGLSQHFIMPEKLPAMKEQWRKELKKEIRAEVLADLKDEAEGKVPEKKEEEEEVKTEPTTPPPLPSPLLLQPAPKPKRKPRRDLRFEILDAKKGLVKCKVWKEEEEEEEYANFLSKRSPIIWKQDEPGYRGIGEPSERNIPRRPALPLPSPLQLSPLPLVPPTPSPRWRFRRRGRPSESILDDPQLDFDLGMFLDPKAPLSPVDDSSVDPLERADENAEEKVEETPAPDVKGKAKVETEPRTPEPKGKEKASNASSTQSKNGTASGNASASSKSNSPQTPYSLNSPSTSTSTPPSTAAPPSKLPVVTSSSSSLLDRLTRQTAASSARTQATIGGAKDRGKDKDKGKTSPTTSAGSSLTRSGIGSEPPTPALDPRRRGSSLRPPGLRTSSLRGSLSSVSSRGGVGRKGTRGSVAEKRTEKGEREEEEEGCEPGRLGRRPPGFP